MTTRPADAVTWRDPTVWTDPETAAFLDEVARLVGPDIYLRPIPGCGSYQTDTEASSNTHAGSGVVDLDCSSLTSDQARWVETCCRRPGGFAWWRPAIPGKWQSHVHVGRSDAVGLHPEAVQQRTWYRQGLNGLWGASQGPDTGTRAYVNVTWASYQEEEMFTQADRDAIAYLSKQIKAVGGYVHTAQRAITAQLSTLGQQLLDGDVDDATREDVQAVLAKLADVAAQSAAVADAVAQLDDANAGDVDLERVYEAARQAVVDVVGSSLTVRLEAGTEVAQ